MEVLDKLSQLIVSQKREMGEILSGFETKNKYVVMEESGKELFYAAETDSSFLGRMFLKSSRPFTITLFDNHKKVVFKVQRPFKFIFHECSIVDNNNILLGKLKWEFSLIRRIYSVTDANNREIYKLFGPMFKPWTFQILRNEQEVGIITKKWSGLFREAFTDADNFGVKFPSDADRKAKAILLGGLFLIDFVHFENKK